MRDEQFRDVVLFVKHSSHQRFLDFVKRAIRQCDSRCHAQRLAGEAALAEELTGVENGDDRLLALLGYDRDLYLAFPDVVQGIRRLSLPKDVVVHSAFQNGLSAEDTGE